MLILTRRLYCVKWTYEHNTVFAWSGPLYATGVSLGPPETLTQTASRSLQLFLESSLCDRPTDRPIDHATRLVTTGGAYSGEAKFCYCPRLQQVFIGAVNSTDRITFSNQQLYSAVRLDGLQCMWRHTTIIASKRAFPRWRRPPFWKKK